MSVYQRAWRSSDLSWATTTVRTLVRAAECYLGRGGTGQEGSRRLQLAEDETKLPEKPRPSCHRISLYPGMEVTLPLHLTTTEAWPPASCRQNPAGQLAFINSSFFAPHCEPTASTGLGYRGLP